jgi:hypothetical protein
MKRSELEKHLGKNVNLEFSDKELNGELVKSEAYKEFGIKTYTMDHYIDHGKIQALRKAGWTVCQIAYEMDMTESEIQKELR